MATVAVADAVLEELRSFNEQLAQLMATLPPPHAVPVEETRAARRSGRGWLPAPVFLPQARELTAPSRAGGLRLRVLRPETEPRGLYLHFHGGGFVFGRADEFDSHLWRLVEETSLCAVSVDYRLAPEHPFPAAPDDCEDAARWLLERGPTELDTPNVVVIGGESAGAYLAAATLLRLRDRHDLAGSIAAANLVYGAYDLSKTPSQRRWRDHLVLTPEALDFFTAAFAPGVGAEGLRDPELSPLYADLHDLPPAIFTVGTRDPLLDDTLFMEARWRLAGNPTELHVWEEGAHAFNLFPIRAAELANAAQHEFLARWTSSSPTSSS
jgi:acetyl esterase/lipase